MIPIPWRSLAGPLRRRAARREEIVCGVHDADVRKRLREIAKLPPRARIVFLRQQPEVVPERKQSLEELRRFVESSDHAKRVGTLDHR